jgi:outer membrane protein TolC
LVLVSVLLLSGPAAVAEELPGHAHAPVPVDRSLTLSGTVDAALAAFPDTVSLAARQSEAQAWVDRGGSWFSGRPSMMLRYQTDRLGSDVGLDEYEAGIELPLWNFGGRDAVQAFGDALLLESAVAGPALRWQVAGLVRMALWDVALAENDHDLAEQSLDTADRLVRLVERRHELGDVALSDVLLAQASYLEFQTALIEASATLLDAERTYRTITALERRPEFIPEPLSTDSEIVADHPALAFANAALARAAADVAVAEQTINTGTSVMIGARRERPAYGTELDDSLGITLNIPFGGSAHRNTAISKAARAASFARANRNRQLRELSLELHEAAHRLNVVHQNIEAASARLEFAERHQAMGELAYEKGEIELIDLLKMQATAIAARRQVSRLLIDEKRQTALYNQAVGDLP